MPKRSAPLVLLSVDVRPRTEPVPPVAARWSTRIVGVVAGVLLSIVGIVGIVGIVPAGAAEPVPEPVGPGPRGGRGPRADQERGRHAGDA